jgi:muconolactone delta-isomerase
MNPGTCIGLYQAAKQWITARFADGKIDLHYLTVETGAGFVIANADSHEELYDWLLEYPLYVFFDFEVAGLVDWSHGYDKIIELLQKIAAMNLTR